jgi:hypothetical protein
VPSVGDTIRGPEPEGSRQPCSSLSEVILSVLLLPRFNLLWSMLPHKLTRITPAKDRKALSRPNDVAPGSNRRRGTSVHRFDQVRAIGCSCNSSKRTRCMFQSSRVGISAFAQPDPAKYVKDSPECRLKMISA